MPKKIFVGDRPGIPPSVASTLAPNAGKQCAEETTATGRDSARSCSQEPTDSYKVCAQSIQHQHPDHAAIHRSAEPFKDFLILAYCLKTAAFASRDESAANQPKRIGEWFACAADSAS